MRALSSPPSTPLPASSPVSALHLRLLPAGAPASGHLDSPSVLLAAGGSGGTVQAWLLSTSAAPALRACWQHRAGGPVLSFALDDGDERLVSVASSSPSTGGGAAEVELHDTLSWRLVNALATGGAAADQGRLLGAQLVPAPSRAAGDAQLLLLCRTSGVQRLVLSPRIAPEGLSAAGSPLAPRAPDGEPPSRTASNRTDVAAALPPGVATQRACEAAREAAIEELAASLGEAACDGSDIEEEDVPRQSVPVPHAANPPHQPPRPAAVGALAASRAGNGRSKRQLPHSPSTDAADGASVRGPVQHPELAEALPGRFDNPLRVLSLLQAPRTDEPVSSLAHPALHSTAALVHQRAEKLEAHSFDADADELSRQAMRDSSALLNTPAAEASRYKRLTPLEPTAVPTARPAARRHHEARWLATRALEPALHELLTPEREPELLSTHVDAAVVQLGQGRRGGGAPTTPCTDAARRLRAATAERDEVAVGFELGEQLPFAA